MRFSAVFLRTCVCVCVCDLYHFAEHLLLAFRRFAHVQSAYTQIYMKINRFKSGKCKLYACAAAAVVEPMAKIFQLNDTESRERLTLFDFQRKMNEFFFLWWRQKRDEREKIICNNSFNILTFEFFDNQIPSIYNVNNNSPNQKIV